MKRGARSVRGAMGTYAVVAAIALLLTAAALFFGPGLTPARARVMLRADGSCSGAVLERPGSQIELRPGQATSLAPGSWRARLFFADGRVDDRELQLRADELIELP